MTVKKVVSAAEIQADMDALADEWEQLAADAMVRVIENPIMSESIVECPFETGLLSSTGTVDEPVRAPGSISVAFGYGTNYGFYVHEIPPGGDFWNTLGAREMTQRIKPAKTTEKGSALDFMAPRKLRTATKTVRNVQMSRTAYHKPPTKWKFLEDPVNRHIDDIPQLVLDDVEALVMKQRAVSKGAV